MIIDLSVTLTNDTPVYPGDPKIDIQRQGSVAEDGYLGHSVTFGTHAGTHIDAPAHMLENASTLGQLPLETFIGPAKLVNEFSIAAVDAANVQPGDILLFHTGASARFNDGTYFSDFPVMDSEVASYIVTKQVKLVGLDTCSADNSDGFPVHKILLGAGIPIIETLTNLDPLHGKAFTIYALPLKLDLDGAPARVIAITYGA